jgi:hypothetical protein
MTMVGFVAEPVLTGDAWPLAALPLITTMASSTLTAAARMVASRDLPEANSRVEGFFMTLSPFF